MLNIEEKILCSAIYYDDKQKRNNLPSNTDTGLVFCGLRHSNCITLMKAMYYDDFTQCESCDTRRKEVLPDHTQGFLTNKNRFLNRTESYLLAVDSKQIKDFKKGYKQKELYSEDLW